MDVDLLWCFLLNTFLSLLSKVHPSSPAIIVRHPEYTPDMPGLVSYPINVANLTSLRQRAAPIFINISCVLTGQRDAVEVKVLAEQHMFGEHPLVWWVQGDAAILSELCALGCSLIFPQASLHSGAIKGNEYPAQI